MNTRTIALIVQEGTRLISEVLRNKALFIKESHEQEVPNGHEEESQSIQASPTSTEKRASSIATGCIPCSIGHLGTCSGLLNEAMRFARKDGIDSDEVIERVNMCMDELNALERVDLRPEMVHGLLDWERPLADRALNLSRSLRHGLEGLSDVSALEAISAETQTTRQEIGKTWFRERLSRMTAEQRKQVEEELRRRADQKDETQREEASK